MGAGESVYVRNQEQFVRANRESFKKELKGYTQLQIDGKLRQLYARTDDRRENEWSYTNPTDWNRAKSKITIKGKRIY
jgi:hypothetical protein